MLLDPSGRVCPPFVHTSGQRRRWESCTRLAVTARERFEPGQATRTWMLITTSSPYFSDISTCASVDATFRGVEAVVWGEKFVCGL